MGRLCLELGLTLSQYRELSAAEIAFWRAYYRVSPFGPERDDLRAARAMHLTASIHTDPKKGKRHEVMDFMPKFEQREYQSRDPRARRKVFDPDAFKEKVAKVFASWRKK